VQVAAWVELLPTQKVIAKAIAALKRAMISTRRGCNLGGFGFPDSLDAWSVIAGSTEFR
jgi:hypothetical protein